jgi:hypothetical protein
VVPLCSPVLQLLATYYRGAEFEANQSVCRLFRLASSPKAEAGVADHTATDHIPTMTLKNAALLALIGTILMTALLVWTFVLTLIQCPAGLGSRGDAFPVTHLCVRPLQCGSILLRVPVACPKSFVTGLWGVGLVLGALCIRHRDASAVLYLLTDTVRMDTDVDDPEQIAEDLYTGKWAKKQ